MSYAGRDVNHFLLRMGAYMDDQAGGILLSVNADIRCRLPADTLAVFPDVKSTLKTIGIIRDDP